MHGHHDMGGLPAGRVVLAEHVYEQWEKRVDALVVLLADQRRQLVRTDELRRNIESLGPDAYERMGYYERWMHAVAQTLIQRGVISIDALARQLVGQDASGQGPFPPAETRGGTTPEPAAVRYRVGDRVRVRAAFPPGHVRTPHYCRGRIGIIERYCGAFRNPEELAYNRSGDPAQPLYRVLFLHDELWPNDPTCVDDTVTIDLYQHWLEPVAPGSPS